MDVAPAWLAVFILGCAVTSWGAAVATFRLVRWIDEHDAE